MSTPSVSVSDTHSRSHTLGGLPGAGRGVCGGGSPLLATLDGGVVHPVAGQQREDEVRRLGAEVRLALHLARFPQLPEPLVIHTCTEDANDQHRASEPQGFMKRISPDVTSVVLKKENKQNKCRMFI